MAKYNREFLVPYLENLCALYFWDKWLAERCEKLNSEINILESTKNDIKELKYPTSLPVVTMGRFLYAVACALSVYIGWKWVPAVWGFWKFGGCIVFLLFVALVIYTWIKGIGEMRDAAMQNKEIVRMHNASIHRNEYRKQIYKDNHQKANLVIETRRGYIQERNKVAQVIQYVYDANIIPKQYRDMYTAVYLYDYFSTSRSDDLDVVLGLYVLEQIKDKLNVVIQELSQVILNQHMIIQNQQNAIKEQRMRTAQMEAKIKKITSIEEERNMYLKMIEKHTATTAYFAEAAEKFIRDF